MTLEKITEIANSYADEQFDEDIIEGFVNEAIARINITLDVDLPFFGIDTTDYDAIDESWQRMIFVPYVTYSIKVNDGSMNEASYAFMQRFESGMRELKRSRSFDIPKKYRLRWVQISEAEYNLAEHKIEYTADGAYEIDPETLPKLGVADELDVVLVKYADTAVKVILEETNEFYQLRDTRQAAPILPKRVPNDNGWWF